jgi:hypothetical protein
MLNGSMQLKGRITGAHVRESLMLEARGTSILFRVVNLVNCGKELCLPLSVFMGEEQNLCAKLLYTCDCKKHCSSFQRIFNVRKKIFQHVV